MLIMFKTEDLIKHINISKLKAKVLRRVKPMILAKTRRIGLVSIVDKRATIFVNAFLQNQKKENGNSPNIANAVEEIIAMVSAMQIVMVTELHMAAPANTSNWWFDSGTTVHVCNEKA